MPELALSAGTIDYQDTSGDDPVLVLLHGAIMDGSLLRHVVAAGGVRNLDNYPPGLPGKPCR